MPVIQDTGPDAFDFFASSDMLEALRVLKAKRQEFNRLGDRVSAARVGAILVDMEATLTQIATKTAAMADEAAIAKLERTRRRPHTGRSQHLEDSIKSEPWLLGSVKVALIEELDKAVNPDDERPYWRTQEYGSEAVGNIMTGRVIYGRFDDDRPRAAFRRSALGEALAPGAEFTWGHPGSGAGYGTIEDELPPREFLREGSDIAWAHYRAEIARLSADAASRVMALMVR